MDNDFLHFVDRERGWKIKIESEKIFSPRKNTMPSITRSLSKFFDREKIPENEREKMLEAAHILLKLSKGN